MSKVFVNVGMTLDGYMVPEGDGYRPCRRSRVPGLDGEVVTASGLDLPSGVLPAEPGAG
jgi:hypothetical protein